MSDHLNSYNPPITQGNDPRLRGALNDFKSQAYDETRNIRSVPCPNCTQLFGNMMAKYGGPNPATRRPETRISTRAEYAVTELFVGNPTSEAVRRSTVVDVLHAL